MCEQKKMYFFEPGTGSDLLIDLARQVSQLLEQGLHGTKLAVSVANKRAIDTLHWP
jgi:hypothetical protein